MNPPISFVIQKFRAIAFDFDGTLVDTLQLHYEAYRRVFESLGLELTQDDFYPNLGGKASEAIPLFLRGRQTKLSINEIHILKKEQIAGLFQHAPVRILPSARLLPILSGILPLALVSAGSRHGIEQLLDRLGWADYFQVLVAGEDTLKSKPDPAPYLLAAEKLGIDPTHVAAFEDTVAGIESARAAGMAVFDVRGNTCSPCP